MIHFLVKVFSEQVYAEKFLRGELYARRLSWFKKLEDDYGRGDEFEAAVIPQLDNLIVTLRSKDTTTGVEEKFTISKEDFASPPIIQLNCLEHVNVFCMYAAHSRGDIKQVSEDNIKEYKKQLELPEEYQMMGDHAVVITNTPEFLNRVNKAANREGYKICQGLVRYYDPEVGVPLPPLDMRIVFAKCQNYAHQREFRFAIDTGTFGCDPITLEIGEIDDIAILMNTADINHQLSLKIKM